MQGGDRGGHAQRGDPQAYRAVTGDRGGSGQVRVGLRRDGGDQRPRHRRGLCGGGRRRVARGQVATQHDQPTHSDRANGQRTDPGQPHGRYAEPGWGHGVGLRRRTPRRSRRVTSSRAPAVIRPADGDAAMPPAPASTGPAGITGMPLASSRGTTVSFPSAPSRTSSEYTEPAASFRVTSAGVPDFGRIRSVQVPDGTSWYSLVVANVA